MKGLKSNVADWKHAAGGMASRSGRLSSFQQTMLLWEKLHPYNATHAVRLSGRADVASLSAAAHRAARESGIGELVLQGDKRTYQYLPLQTISVRELPETIDANQTLCAIITEELNVPFSRGPHHPIRWVVFNEDSGDAHFVVLVYHHVASDGLGVQAFLGLVLAHYLCFPGPSESRPFAMEAKRREQTPDHRNGTTQYFRPLIRTAIEYFRLRSAHRMRERKGGGEETAFVTRGAGYGVVERLNRACRDRKVGLNDVILAATGSAIAELTAPRREHSRRRKLALSTIVNLRETVGGRFDTAFGVHLRDCVILLDDPDAGFAGVLEQVCAQTRKLRADRTADQASRLPFVRYLWPLMRIPHTRASYQKIFPVCAGVSTIAGSELRFEESAASVLRYVRACPPGPAMPMVIAPTVMGSRMELTLVCRESCLDANQMSGLLDRVLSKVQNFADAAQHHANEEVEITI